MKVKVLADNVINKIAAGEVVERPASVVREIVENSVDAGATEVSVFLEQGGQTLIRVIDNGSGMEKADALLALERHATSKIENSDDLFSITTLGFRGEALPSIAAVSRMRICTRPAEKEIGTEIVINAGTIAGVTSCSMPCGTQIEIRSLFYNVPARRKFLRSVKYEELRIKEWLIATALSKPTIRFRLIADERELLNLAPRATMLERAAELIRGNTLPFDVSVGDGERKVRVIGVVAHPSQARADAGGLHLLVNGRVIHDRMLLRAVREGFLTTLKDREYPVGFLALQIDPSQVDVNVHPQKSEVRFRDGRPLFVLVKESVARAVRDFRAPLAAAMDPSHAIQYPARPRPVAPEHAPIDWGTSRMGDDSVAPGISVAESPRGSYLSLVSQNSAQAPLFDGAPRTVDTAAHSNFRFSELRYLAQALDCFLLCQHGQELVVVDMHAAHERVNYNLIREAIRAKTLTSQALLIPERISVGDFGNLRIAEEQELLQRCGIEIEPSADGTMLLKAVPSGFRIDPKQLLREIAVSLPDESARGAFDEVIDKVAARLACHASIRSGEGLTREEVYELFDALDQAELSAACPHGRPVVVSFARVDVEAWFGRDR